MKTLFSVFASVLISFTLTAQAQGLVSLEKPLPAFSSVIIDLPANVEINGSKDSNGILVAFADDLQKIEWEVQDGKLVIRAAEGALLEGPVNFSLASTQLASVESSEDAVIYMHHVDRQRLSLNLRRGAIKLEGAVDELRLMVERAKVYAPDFQARSAYVNVWDEGNIILNASETLEIDATNNGKVIYSGQPALLKKNLSNGAIATSKEELENQELVDYVNFQLQ